MNLISVRHLTVTFGERPVLRDISLDIPDDGPCVLLGHSGAGKTTLLRAFNRLNECFPDCHSTGEVYIRLKGTPCSVYDKSSYGRGAPLASLYALRRRVGMVFQTPNVLPMSTAQNLRLPLQSLENINGKIIRCRMESALEAVELWHEVKDRLHDPAANLSGGQQQRLCLARAIALEPEILLLDEPTASLDPAATEVVEHLILKLSQRFGIILVCHSLPQALRLGRNFVLVGPESQISTLTRENISLKILHDFFGKSSTACL